MSEIILKNVYQESNIIKDSSVDADIYIEFKSNIEQRLLKVKVTYSVNIKNSKHVQHRSVSIWQNVDFTINPQLISSNDFDTLISITQTSMGQARVMFINENLPYILELPLFFDNKEIGDKLKLLIQTHYN